MDGEEGGVEGGGEWMGKKGGWGRRGVDGGRRGGWGRRRVDGEEGGLGEEESEFVRVWKSSREG